MGKGEDDEFSCAYLIKVVSWFKKKGKKEEEEEFKLVLQSNHILCIPWVNVQIH